MVVTVIHRSWIGHEHIRTMSIQVAGAFVAAYKKAAQTGAPQRFEYHGEDSDAFSRALLCIQIDPADKIWIASH